MELNYCECHCVSEVFIEELNKWIVVDVALNLFYFNKRGEILNLYEIRQHILRNEPFSKIFNVEFPPESLIFDNFKTINRISLIIEELISLNNN